MSMNDMVRTLANLPYEKASNMVKDRMNLFYEAKDEERIEGMTGMLTALGEISEEGHAKLLRARIESLATFPEQTRMTLMGAHMKIIKGLPNIAMREKKLMQSIMPDLSDPAKNLVKQMMESMNG